MKTVKTVMIGVGNISGIYLKNIHETFHEIELIGVCDLVRERAEKAQREYGIPKIYETMHDAFADPEVEMVLNLTRPYEHFEVSRGRAGGGQECVQRKAPGRGSAGGQRAFGTGQAEGPQAGRRAGYVSGRGHPDLPPPDR